MLQWKSFTAVQIKRQHALAAVLDLRDQLLAQLAKAAALAAWQEALDNAAKVHQDATPFG